VRETAAEMLARSGAHGELLLIEGILKDMNPMIRAAAAYPLHLIFCIFQFIS